MIAQYQFSCVAAKARLYPSTAYKLYAWLLELLPNHISEQLHNDQYNPLSQYLYFDRNTNRHIWTVNILDTILLESVKTVFENIVTAETNDESIKLDLLGYRHLNGASDLIMDSRSSKHNFEYAKLVFPVTTSFKVSGRYCIFPTERLILQSLVNRWNACFPKYVLADDDAFSLLEQNLHIVQYKLQSSKYCLKGQKIPGFTGEIVIQSKLSAPMMEIWNMLFSFASFSGVGIKTSLGMGGVLAV